MFASLQNQHQEAGQGLVEYALILVLVAVAVILGLTVMGDRVQTAFEYVLISTQHTSVDALIDHCLEGANNGQINSLKNQAVNNPATFETRINELGDAGTITSACRTRLIDLSSAR